MSYQDLTDKLPDYIDLFGSVIQKELTDDEEKTKADIDLLLKRIDRRIKRYSQSDTEIVGAPDFNLSSKDLIPISVFNTDGLNSFGGMTGGEISSQLDDIEKEKNFRFNRYQRLAKTIESPEADGILMVYADEATNEDTEGEILHIISPNKKMKEVVIDLFKRCNIHDRAWQIIYNMCGYGDEFYNIIPALSGDRIAKMEWVPRNKIERIEQNNILMGFKALNTSVEDDSSLNGFLSYRYTNINYNDKDHFGDDIIHPFRILHFKIPSDKYLPYGKSVIDSIVSPIEQLNMMIKAMLIARVARAPERRIFNIDVGNLQGELAIKYAYDAVNYLKKKKQLGSSNGRLSPDLINDSFGVTEDIVIPKRANSEGNSIETLPAIAPPATDDVEFLNNRIFPPTGVPKEYLYDTQFANVSSSLSSKSVLFAKRIKRVQRFFLLQLYKLATIELKLRGFANEEIDSLIIYMNNPSNTDDKEKIELNTSIWGLIRSIKQNNTEGIFYPDYLIYKKFLKMNDDEIVELLKLAQLQAAGENIFNFLPPDERPEEAKDLGGDQDASNPAPSAGGPIGGDEPSPEDVAMTALGAPEPEGTEIIAAETPAPEMASTNPNMKLNNVYLESLDKKNKLIQKFNEIQNQVFEDIKENKIKDTSIKGINVNFMEENGELEGLNSFFNYVQSQKENVYNEEED